MSTSSPEIRIHLADRRNNVSTGISQTLFSLPFKAEDGKRPFGSLNVFCQVTQKPGTIMQHVSSTHGVLFVLPLVGEVVINDEIAVDAGQLHQTVVVQGKEVKLENAYPSEWISYLLWESETEQRPDARTYSFDIETSIGSLVNVIDRSDHVPLAVHIGMFNGRQEATLTLRELEHRFIFVIEGAFEVQNRLLHARDGLSLPDCPSLEFEALSNKAIILSLGLNN